MTQDRENRIKALCAAVQELTDGQIGWIEAVVNRFEQPASFKRNPASDLLDDCVLQDFGDALRIHHSFSKEPFTKDKFEYALERVLKFCGGDDAAELAPKGNPGHDITIKGVPFSLKTQADKNISVDHIHISKFHELGKGSWGDQDADLVGLREQFFEHMRSYGRILSLRCLETKKTASWRYELVEIPKGLLAEAAAGQLEMKHNSKQYPKPGYCYVTDEAGNTRFQLYFDGGTERKLQIKRLDKSLCIVHAEWIFSA
ncbi:restriction endonuclease [Candidatus Thiothrix sp. Deng01]|uniref:Restriction endonuclease n=1 Tax=Candidatus Thiothrix phosphatis TaxID=3112415 RepID=A0ABU6CRN7_9GAMM|nr:hypothetical protein [Candidatus Thiothrix sp. Deng01]MEB4589445.1 restriction endonuclease [Candidatus Thiothrix sp. Deng01]